MSHSASPQTLPLQAHGHLGPVAAALSGICAFAALFLSADSTEPEVLGVVAFVSIAVATDLASNRIPNLLTFPAFAFALGLAAWSHGTAGVLVALIGAFAGLAIFVIPYAAGALGAGDAKAAMVIGALLGPIPILTVSAWSILFGGLIGIGWVAVRGQLPDLVRRWGQTLLLSLSGRKLVYFPPEEGSAAARGLPFAVAVGLGLLAYWGIPA